MRLDAGFTLPDLFLQKVDVATMAFSLEARCPMTDYRLVEWAMRLPIEYKLRGGETKYLLKKALRRHLPRGSRLSAEDGVRSADRELAARPVARLGARRWSTTTP